MEGVGWGSSGSFFGSCRTRGRPTRGTICWRCCSSRLRQCCVERNRAPIWRISASRRKGCCGFSCAWSMASRATTPLAGCSVCSNRKPSSSPSGNLWRVDGKALRGAYERGGRANPLHLVNVFAVDARMALAQQKAPGRNETRGALEVLDLLCLDGCIVTADALHCHRAFADAVLQRGGDYVLAIKANRGPLFTAVTPNSLRDRASAAPPSRSTSPLTTAAKRDARPSCVTPAW